MKTIRNVTNIICVAIIAAMVILILVRWNSLPDEVPVHFTFDGTADAYGDKNAIIRTPIIAMIMFAVVAVLEHFPKLWNMPVAITAENMEREYLIIGIMLSVTKVLVVILFLLSEISALAQDFPAWPMMALIILMLAEITCGIVMSIRCR